MSYIFHQPVYNKEKWPQDRPLWNATQNVFHLRGEPRNSSNLGSTTEATFKPRQSPQPTPILAYLAEASG